MQRPRPGDVEADQFYLALRLASLEGYCPDIGPMPIVPDDVLVTFNDEHTTATLRVVADLSQDTI